MRSWIGMQPKQRHMLDLGRHHPEVVHALVSVPAYPQIDLRQSVQAVVLPGVQQHGHLQAVPDWNRQRLQQLAAHSPFAADRLNHRRQFGPFQVQQQSW